MAEVQNVDLALMRRLEHERIVKATESDRKWWPMEKRILSLDEAREEVSRGNLIEVKNGDNFRLIGRLNGKEDGEPVWLRPKAYELLQLIDRLFGEVKVSGGVAKLAVTSLYRDKALQEKLQQGTQRYFAAEPGESSHLAGAAFDISCRSYYVAGDDGTITPAMAWKVDSPFEKEVMDRLRQISEGLGTERGNWVVERVVDDKGVLIDSVYHFCVNPEWDGK